MRILDGELDRGLLLKADFGLVWENEDFAPRPEDYAWAAKEIGDVPYRELSDSLTPFYEANPVVPVESLGRDSDG